MDLKSFGHYKCQFLASFSKLSLQKINIQLIFFFWQTQGRKWTVPNDFLAKKEKLFFYEGMWPLAASMKKGILVLRLTIVVGWGVQSQQINFTFLKQFKLEIK